MAINQLVVHVVEIESAGARARKDIEISNECRPRQWNGVLVEQSHPSRFLAFRLSVAVIAVWVFSRLLLSTDPLIRWSGSFRTGDPRIRSSLRLVSNNDTMTSRTPRLVLYLASTITT